MDIDESLTSVIASCEYVVISPTKPKYSEVWMSKMSRMLAPSVVCVVMSDPSMQPMKLYDVDGITTVSLSKSSGFFSKIIMFFLRPLVRKRLRRIVNDIESDVPILVHYLTTAIALYSVLSSLSGRVFIHCHGHDVTWGRRYERFPLLPAQGPFYKKSVKRLSKIFKFIANSLATKNKLLEIGVAEKSININYLSVDVDEIFPVEKVRSEEVGILYLGRLTDFKGPTETIIAFEKAKDAGLKGTLTMAGGGHLFKQCVSMAKASPYSSDIKIIGPVSRDVAIELYAASDIFTAHNKRSKKTGQEEAFGVSIIEAMSAGLAVVTGRSGGVVETVLDGETGLLFEPEDVQAHADCLVELYRNREFCSDLGANGRSRIIKDFNSVDDRLKIRGILDGGRGVG